MLLSFQNITKGFGGQQVISPMTAAIENTDRIGLIGANGAGKTTLLEMICGFLEPDTGEISREDTASIGFLRQNNGLEMSGSILSEMRRPFADLLEDEKRMRSLEKEIGSIPGQDPRYQRLSEEYARLSGNFEQHDGYRIDVKIQTVLNGMGFGGREADTPVSVLSGGEKTRLAISRLLLEEPNLLVLDEPTNHLDFKTLAWLEEYLAGYKGALLIVSHDRYFLDKLSTRIWEIERGRLSVYKGNYSRYLDQKAERYARLQKEYEAQQKEIAQLKDYVARNMARASTSAMAKSRQNTLDKMEVLERPLPPPKTAKLSFSFEKEPVKDVLHAKGLTVRLDDMDAPLFSQLDFDLLKGEKVALIGENGVGKTSFFRALLGKLPYKGSVEWGRNVRVSYFDQEEESLSPEKRAIDQIWDRFPGEYEHSVRTMLGNLRLSGESVFKRVGDLSGGEKARLKFAALMLEKGNLLILDEPTNHLDLPTKEALEQALGAYEGTLLIISHDRYLLNKIPSRIVEMTPDSLRTYPGQYERYLDAKQREAADGSPARTEEKPPSGNGKPSNSYHRGKKQRSQAAARKSRLAELEKTIADTEKLLADLEAVLADPGNGADYQKLEDTCLQLEKTRNELDQATVEWLSLAEEHR